MDSFKQNISPANAQNKQLANKLELTVQEHPAIHPSILLPPQKEREEVLFIDKLPANAEGDDYLPGIYPKPDSGIQFRFWEQFFGNKTVQGSCLLSGHKVT